MMYVLALGVLGSILSSVANIAPVRNADDEHFAERYDEIGGIVVDNFFDPAFGGVDFESVLANRRAGAIDSRTPEDFARSVNEVLDVLNVSHTHYFIDSEPKYYELLDIFNADGVPEGTAIRPGTVYYGGMGIVAREVEKAVFAAEVYETGPAWVAGLMQGDELLAIDGRPFTNDTRLVLKADRPVTIAFRRTESGPVREIEVTPRWINPRALFLDTLRGSARIIERDGASVAYVRIRSYGHPQFHEMLKELLVDQFASADALVLDIRNGWGGANLTYLDVFNPVTPVMAMKGRDATDWNMIRLTWKRPVVLLIDEGSRSGKELIAYAFRKYGIGTVVGTRTAGAVVGGRLFTLSDGSLLYLAVVDVEVDGIRLEGIGVEPDIVVEDPLPYRDGRDAQLERALGVAAEQAAREPDIQERGAGVRE